MITLHKHRMTAAEQIADAELMFEAGNIHTCHAILLGIDRSTLPERGVAVLERMIQACEDLINFEQSFKGVANDV